MNPRRMKRKIKQKKKLDEKIPCIVFLATDEYSSDELANRKENRQLHYISNYASAHGLKPMKIVRAGSFGVKIRMEIFERCIKTLKTGQAEAILVANISNVAEAFEDICKLTGLIQKRGFRLFTVDDGEIFLSIKPKQKEIGKDEENKKVS